MASTQSRVFEIWGISPNEGGYNSKKESLILRISPSSYMRKQSARPVQSNEQLVKLELGYDGRVAKAMNIYLSPDAVLYKQLEQVFDEFASNQMLDVPAVSVNQTRRT